MPEWGSVALLPSRCSLSFQAPLGHKLSSVMHATWSYDLALANITTTRYRLVLKCEQVPNKAPLNTP